jgi:DNA-binding CsgD family transcriptional regulator
LTRGEREELLWVADGLSNAEIASGMSEGRGGSAAASCGE